MTADATLGGGVTIGIDIGGTKVLGVALDPAGTVLADARVPTPEGLGPAASGEHPDGESRGDEFAEAVAEVTGTLCATLAIDPVGLTMGVGAPGMVDNRGVLRFAPNLPGAAGADVAALMARPAPPTSPGGRQRRHPGGARRTPAGRRPGGRRRADGDAGDGHRRRPGCRGPGARGGRPGLPARSVTWCSTPTVRPVRVDDGAVGSDMRRAAVSVASAGRRRSPGDCPGWSPWPVATPRTCRGEHVTAAARGGDGAALSVFVELGWWLALGLANLVAVLDPRCIVLGGGMAGAGDILAGPTRAAFGTLVEGMAVRPAIDIRAAAFGERAGAVGAALAARGTGLR